MAASPLGGVVVQKVSKDEGSRGHADQTSFASEWELLESTLNFQSATTFKCQALTQVFVEGLLTD
jgi:hypothetical protein